MEITCCNGCVPPKRTPTCKFDGTCGKYAEAKKKHDKEKAIENQLRSIQAGLTSQAFVGINRAKKAQRKMKGRNYGW